MTLMGLDQSTPISGAGVESVQHKPETNPNPIPHHTQEGGRRTLRSLHLSKEGKLVQNVKQKKVWLLQGREPIAENLLTAGLPKLQGWAPAD